MSKKSIEEQVAEFTQPVVEPLGLELVDVEFVKEGANWYLRVYIDKPGGVEVEDCQEVSGKVSDLLDQRDPIPQAYFLEVSSPGLDRPLKKDKDFERYSGELVKVNTYAPIDGKKSFTGNLLGLQEDGIHLEVKGQEMVFPRDKVSSVRLEISF